MPKLSGVSGARGMATSRGAAPTPTKKMPGGGAVT